MRPIKGFEGLYSVSPSGDVYSIKNDSVRKTFDSKGYKLVQLWKNNKGKNFSVHRLVSEAYLPNPFCKPDVNHKDGNKHNNHFTNLEWVTRSENAIHAIKVLGIFSERIWDVEHLRRISPLGIEANRVRREVSVSVSNVRGLSPQ